MRLRAPHCAATISSLPPMLGRTKDLEELSRLCAGRNRLIVLSGPTGVGKSRLAMEYARSGQRDFPAGVHLVDASAASSAEEISRLSAEPPPPYSREEEPPALLLVDNHDPTRTPLDGPIWNLLRSRPNLTVLTTTRQVVGRYGEQPMFLSPLPQDPGPGGCPLDAPSVRLLLERSRLNGFQDSLDTADRSAIVDISRAVDGLPLAIEFVAPWLGIIGITAVRDRLRAGIDLLSSSPGSVSLRHRSLSAALSETYEALPGQARALLLELSEHEGHVTGPDLGAVTGGFPDGESLLRLLIERNLVCSGWHADHGPSLTLLNTTRMFVREKAKERERQAASPGPAEGDQHPHPLTQRQAEVARLVANGMTNREIAKGLGISEWTAINHVREVMRRLRCSSRVQVAKWVVATLGAERHQYSPRPATAPAVHEPFS